MPQWNADGVSQNALCRIFNRLGIAALRMSMPYHDIRRPEGFTRADYAVSANIGRTIHAVKPRHRRYPLLYGLAQQRATQTGPRRY